MQRLPIIGPRIFFPLLTLILTALHLYVWTLPRTPTAIPEPNTPEAQWWGLWPVTYLPGWAMGLGVGLILLSLAVCVWRPGWFVRLGKRDGGMTVWSLVIGGLVMGGLVIGFYSFPIVHTRWGDAYILTKALAHPDPALRLTRSWQAPLDLFLHSSLWQILHDRMGWRDAMPVYRLLSPVAGVLYLWAVWGLARALPPTPRWLTFALLSSLGVMQLFFGYVENYSFAAAGILWYLVFGLAALAGRRPLWQAALILALTNALHPSTIVYGPSLLYIGWQRAKERNNSWGSNVLQMAVPLALVAGATILLMEVGGHGIATLLTTDRPGGGDARWLVPLWETSTRWEQYTMFSWPHLRDLLNEQLLVAPLLLPLLCLTVFAAKQTHVTGDSRDGGSTAPQRVTRFLALAACCHLVLIWTWNPDYGGQRDWDLFSLAAIPTAALVAQRLPALFSKRQSLVAGIIPLLVLQYWHLAAWVYQNTLPWEWP
ncbi:MAG: hypothetical protein R2932_04605 [Caldilineaceae bacterium]